MLKTYGFDDAHILCIHICIMRTKLVIDDELIERARELTGIQEKTALVHAGLRALIAREAGKRLAALGGSEAKLASIPRRRPARKQRAGMP
jgi:Arc/MetJ family transcription regulator